MTSDEVIEDLLGSLHDLSLFESRRKELAAIFAERLQPYIGQMMTDDDYKRIGTAIGEELRNFRARHRCQLDPTVAFDETTGRITVSVSFPAVARNIDLRLDV